MAKKEMVCPFSSRLCKNCPAYIGRHYLMCYNPHYRGHMKYVKKIKGSSSHPVGSFDMKKFSMPKLEYNEKLDPFTKQVD